MTDPFLLAGETLEDALARLERESVRQVRLLDMTSRKGEGYDGWRVVRAHISEDAQTADLWVCRFPTLDD